MLNQLALVLRIHNLENDVPLASGELLHHVLGRASNRNRPTKSSTKPRKAKTWCALKFKWTAVLVF